jgi:hypothetical protein
MADRDPLARQGCTAIVTNEERLEQLRKPWLRDVAIGLAFGLALVALG